MTYEQMLELAERVVQALRAAGFDNPEVLKEDATPGEAIPISFGHDGGDFALDLDVL